MAKKDMVVVVVVVLLWWWWLLWLLLCCVDVVRQNNQPNKKKKKEESKRWKWKKPIYQLSFLIISMKQINNFTFKTYLIQNYKSHNSNTFMESVNNTLSDPKKDFFQ